jgi:hypothetical protein
MATSWNQSKRSRSSRGAALERHVGEREAAGALVRDERAALEVLHVRDLDGELAALLEASVADVVDLHDELELLVEAARVADDGHGLAPHHTAAAELGLEGARVLADAEDDELGRLVGGEAHASDELAGEDDGGRVELVGDVDEEGLAGVSLRNAPLFICARRNAVMVRRTCARSPSVLFLCRANSSPCLRLRSMKMTPRRSATYGKLPSPLSVREPSM